jgi:ferrochelatase
MSCFSITFASILAIFMSINTPTGVLLLQLGTPDSPSTSDVRRYLREFLMDPRVIDVPYVLRQVLVNGIIANFRAPKSARLYREIWTDAGSPLLVYGTSLRDKLQEKLGDSYRVALGMRYRNPSTITALRNFKKDGISRIILLPLFPQFASSSSGSALEYAYREITSWQFIPEIRSISSYYDDPQFIKLWTDKGRAMLEAASYDFILFTFHGVPWRHIRTSGCSGSCQKGPEECPAISHDNAMCYRAQCFASARAVIQSLQLPAEKTRVTFQSRLGNDPWLTPYTDKTLIELAKEGKKRILVFSMAFVADCLETIHEVSTEYQELFEEYGGHKLQLVPSLNDDEAWVEYLAGLAQKNNADATVGANLS